VEEDEEEEGFEYFDLFLRELLQYLRPYGGFDTNSYLEGLKSHYILQKRIQALKA
jgi:hypothetical protein